MSWICSKCRKSFALERSLKKHKCNPKCCIICRKLFKTMRTLRQHRCNGRMVNFACEVCGKKFSTTTTLRRHSSIQHKMEDAKDVLTEDASDVDEAQEEFFQEPEVTLTLMKEDTDTSMDSLVPSRSLGLSGEEAEQNVDFEDEQFSTDSEESISDIEATSKEPEDIGIDWHKSIGTILTSNFFKNELQQTNAGIIVYLAHDNLRSFKICEEFVVIIQQFEGVITCNVAYLKSLYSNCKYLLNIDVGTWKSLRKHFIEETVVRALRMKFRVVAVILDVTIINLVEIANFCLTFSIENNFQRIPIIYDIGRMKLDSVEGMPFFKPIISRAYLLELEERQEEFVAKMALRPRLIFQFKKHSIANMLELIRRFFSANPNLNYFLLENISPVHIENLMGNFEGIINWDPESMISELRNAIPNFRKISLFEEV